MFSQKIVPQKIVTINIHDRLSNEATDMDVFVKVAMSRCQRRFIKLLVKEIKLAV
jgi:hypothetical protein